MNTVNEIIDSYIEWQRIAESDEYKRKSWKEKESLRLQLDEDAKYYKSLGLSDSVALHADVIFSFWTIYKALLKKETGRNYYRTIESLTKLKERAKTDERIQFVNQMVSDFASVCYSKGNYMLLPYGCRAMNNQRYMMTQDRIDATLYHCFGKGLLAKFFKSDEDAINWIKEQKLDVFFTDNEICPENIKWAIEEKSPKWIDEMSSCELQKYVEYAADSIKERCKA